VIINKLKYTSVFIYDSN